MRQAVAILAVAVLLVLSGCATSLNGGSTDTPTPTLSPTQAPTANPTSSPTASPTSTVSPTPTEPPVDPDNPYGERTITLYVDYRTDLDINRSAELRNATAYWEANSEEYAGYPINFEFTNDPDAADLEIIIQDEIERCGTENNTDRRLFGCAPVPEDSPPLNNDIELVADMLPRDFRWVAQHELGHALGLEHGEGPTALMKDTYNAQVIERVYRYTVTIDDQYHIGGTKDQIEAGLGFIEDGANGTIRSSVRFKEVDSASQADFHIRITGDESLCEDRYYCADYESSPTQIITANTEREYIAWMVSYTVWTEVAYDVGATERPYEHDPDNVDPSKSWWR